MEVTRGDFYKITSCFVEKEYCNTPSIINVIHKDNSTEELFYLLALLNSRLYTWYHLKNHSKSHAETSIPKILVREIKNLPFVNKKCDINQKLIKIVNQILSLKQADPQADTSALEKEIDQLVYQLYGLTEEEIRIESERRLV